jgi:hypothetical protein
MKASDAFPPRATGKPAEYSAPGAAPTTVEALMYSLRSRGTAALLEPDCRRRLSELSAEQTRAVAVRLQNLKPHIAPAWDADQISALLKVKAAL